MHSTSNSIIQKEKKIIRRTCDRLKTYTATYRRKLRKTTQGAQKRITSNSTVQNAKFIQRYGYAQEISRNNSQEMHK